MLPRCSKTSRSCRLQHLLGSKFTDRETFQILEFAKQFLSSGPELPLEMCAASFLFKPTDSVPGTGVTLLSGLGLAAVIFGHGRSTRSWVRSANQTLAAEQPWPPSGPRYRRNLHHALGHCSAQDIKNSICGTNSSFNVRRIKCFESFTNIWPNLRAVHLIVT